MEGFSADVAVDAVFCPHSQRMYELMAKPGGRFAINWVSVFDDSVRGTIGGFYADENTARKVLDWFLAPPSDRSRRN